MQVHKTIPVSEQNTESTVEKDFFPTGWDNSPSGSATYIFNRIHIMWLPSYIQTAVYTSSFSTIECVFCSHRGIV